MRWRADGDPCSAAADVDAGALRQLRLVSGVAPVTLPVSLFSGVSLVADGFEELVMLLGAIFGRGDQVARRKGQSVRERYEELDQLSCERESVKDGAVL